MEIRQRVKQKIISEFIRILILCLVPISFFTVIISQSTKATNDVEASCKTDSNQKYSNYFERCS